MKRRWLESLELIETYESTYNTREDKVLPKTARLKSSKMT